METQADRDRASKRRYYERNKEKILAYNKREKQEKSEYIRDLKTRTPCTDCGKKYPYYVMDFDHLEDKKNLINQIILRNSWETLELEIAKCEIVCSNCHRIRTHTRRLKT